LAPGTSIVAVEGPLEERRAEASHQGFEIEGTARGWTDEAVDEGRREAERGRVEIDQGALRLQDRDRQRGHDGRGQVRHPFANPSRSGYGISLLAQVCDPPGPRALVAEFAPRSDALGSYGRRTLIEAGVDVPLSPRFPRARESRCVDAVRAHPPEDPSGTRYSP